MKLNAHNIDEQIKVPALRPRPVTAQTQRLKHEFLSIYVSFCVNLCPCDWKTSHPRSCTKCLQDTKLVVEWLTHLPLILEVPGTNLFPRPAPMTGIS
jgi:hypothetical protein